MTYRPDARTHTFSFDNRALAPHRRDEWRPPWLVLLSGYLFIEGVFATCSFFLRIRNLDDLLYLLPPFSFMHWYAYEFAWGWVLALGSFLHWTIPILKVMVACAIWHAPARTKRLVVIVASAVALEAGIRALALPGYAQVYVTPIAFRLMHLPRLALAVFVTWFVLRIERRERPEATLILAFLLLTSVGGFAGTIATVIEEGFRMPLGLIRRYGLWSFVLENWWIDQFIWSSLILTAGLLLLRTFPRVKTVAALVVFANVMSLTVWVSRISTGMFGPFGGSWPTHTSLVLPIVGHVGIAVCLARFLWRHPQLFVTDEPLCRICRYNLTGNITGVCPECGTKIESP